jgi:ABC-type bacteriocin/lantibiotic exporter with double-glycine peptidase domain
LDAESEAAVVDALDQLITQKTTIMVSHVLSTLRHADAIFVITDGRISDQTTFAGLARFNHLLDKT